MTVAPRDARSRFATPRTSQALQTDGAGQPLVGVGTLNLSARAEQLVLEALRNNRLSYGPMMQRFEQEFAKLHQCRFGVMTNSGTSSLQIALQALKAAHGWADGDEVIVPAVTFVATANIVLHNQMWPVLVDVEPTYYELDPAKLEEKITPRTRAIIPVHLFGHPADMRAIREIAAKHDLRIIEDSCETMFACQDGASVGSLGDIGCFSTYVAHLLVTGVGGLTTTNDPDLAVRLRSLMNHGRDSIYISIDDDDNKSAEELRMIIARRFRFVSIGHSFRATELEAAIGLAQLDDWQSMIAARRANGASLNRRLAHLSEHLQLPATRAGSDHSFMMFPVVLRDEPKEGLVNFLEQNGVETRDMLPLTNQPAHQRVLGIREEDYPVAQWINRNGFYVGCHQDLSELHLDHMVELFERYYRRRRSKVLGGAALVIQAQGDAAAMNAVVDAIPTDLFEKVIAIDLGCPPETTELLRARDIEVHAGSADDAMARVARGDVDLPFENLVFFAADGRENPNDLARVVLALERGNDMVVASRFMPGGGRQDRQRRFSYRSVGNRVFTLVANLLFYGNTTDALTPFRAIKRRRLREAQLDGRGVAAAYQLAIEAMRREWKIAEIPTIELVPPPREERWRVIRSIGPLVAVLVRMWRRRTS